GSVTAVAGQASKTVAGTTAGSVSLAADAGSLARAAGNPITFSVVHAGADHISLTGSTADLTSGQTRTVTATIYDLNNNVVTSGPDSTLSIAFAKTNIGGGSVTGTGTASAVAGVATKTLTGVTVGLVTIGAGHGRIRDSLSFTVVHAAANHISLTGSTADLISGQTRSLTATIYVLNTPVATLLPARRSSDLFAKTNIGGGSVTGTGSASAVAGVATKTLTGVTVGLV